MDGPLKFKGYNEEKKAVTNDLPDWLIDGAVLPGTDIWACCVDAWDNGTFNPARFVASWAIDLSVGKPSVSVCKEKKLYYLNFLHFDGPLTIKKVWHKKLWKIATGCYMFI